MFYTAKPALFAQRIHAVPAARLSITFAEFWRDVDVVLEPSRLSNSGRVEHHHHRRVDLLGMYFYLEQFCIIVRWRHSPPAMLGTLVLVALDGMSISLPMQKAATHRHSFSKARD